MTARCLIVIVALLGGAMACADEYWVAYEGNDFPENEGWRRRIGGGGAVRRIEDGVLTIDSLRDQSIFDFYDMERLIDPDPGEMFIAEWRLRVVETPGFRDAGVVIARDTEGTLSLQYFLDRVISTREGWSIPIEPREFHSYRIESFDMVTYAFSLDGQHVLDGEWDANSLNQSFVAFGDGGQFGNATSLTEWDYFRFGVVPEPHSGLLAGVAALLFWRRAGRRGKVSSSHGTRRNW